MRRTDLHPVGVLSIVHGAQLAGWLAPTDVRAELELAKIWEGLGVRGGCYAPLLPADKVVDDELGVDDRLEDARAGVGLDAVVEAPGSGVSSRPGGVHGGHACVGDVCGGW